MAAPAPAGIKPQYVSSKEKEKYGLQGLPYKLFKKAFAISDLDALGVFSVFGKISAEVKVRRRASLRRPALLFGHSHTALSMSRPLQRAKGAELPFGLGAWG